MAKKSVTSSRPKSKRAKSLLPKLLQIERPARPWREDSVIRWLDNIQSWANPLRRGPFSGIALDLGDSAAQFRHRYLVLLSLQLAPHKDAALIELESYIHELSARVDFFILDSENASLAGIQKHAGKHSAKKAKQKHKLILDFVDRHQIKSAASLLSKGRHATPRLIGKINEKEYVVDERGKPIGRPLGDAGLENIWNRLAKQRKKIK